MLNPGGSWAEGDLEMFHIISAASLYIYNYYKIKRVLKTTFEVISR